MMDDILFRTGKGHWNYFQLSLDEIKYSAEKWRQEVNGIDKLWLCWNVDPEWCLVQQKLVSNLGWTPLVGGDPRAKKPSLLKESIYIDFNQDFKLPMLHMLFPIEFSFLFAEKLAFWHSDLLVRESKLSKVNDIFNSINDGDMVVTEPSRSLRMKIMKQSNRYWELLACTTKAASQSQFDCGSGWFGHVHKHPNSPSGEFKTKSKLYYDHGTGIKYWAKKHKPINSNIELIKEAYIEEGHCTRIRKPEYIAQSPNNSKRDLSKDLTANYDLKHECEKLDLLKVYNSVIK